MRHASYFFGIPWGLFERVFRLYNDIGQSVVPPRQALCQLPTPERWKTWSAWPGNPNQEPRIRVMWQPATPTALPHVRLFVRNWYSEKPNIRSMVIPSQITPDPGWSLGEINIVRRTTPLFIPGVGIMKPVGTLDRREKGTQDMAFVIYLPSVMPSSRYPYW